MSTSTEPPAQQVSQFDLETTPGQGGVGEAAGAYWGKIKGGDLGSLPAILGCVVLIIVFGVLQPDSFLTKQNFANLLNQGAGIMVLSMGGGLRAAAGRDRPVGRLDGRHRRRDPRRPDDQSRLELDPFRRR